MPDGHAAHTSRPPAAGTAYVVAAGTESGRTGHAAAKAGHFNRRRFRDEPVHPGGHAGGRWPFTEIKRRMAHSALNKNQHEKNEIFKKAEKNVVALTRFSSRNFSRYFRYPLPAVFFHHFFGHMAGGCRAAGFRRCVDQAWVCASLAMAGTEEERDTGRRGFLSIPVPTHVSVTARVGAII